MNRRKFLLLATNTLLTAAATKAGASIGSDKESTSTDNDLKMINPYQTIGNYKEDRHRVFMFIDFDCPFCAESWYGAGEWGADLPEPFKFVYVPLFGTSRMNTAAVAFYALRELAPKRLPEYMRQAFALGATGNKDNRQYPTILKKMGFSDQQIDTAIKLPITERRIKRAITLAKNYRVRRTPTFGIAGKYATTLDYTNGNYKLFTGLLNSLVTKAIENS